MKKLFNRKGFTMAELLIVVAIIAILAAIAIPTFSSQLNSSKVGTDHANIRSAYSQMRVAELTGEITPDGETSSESVKNNSYFMGANGNLDDASGTLYKLQGTETNCSIESVGALTGHTAGNYIKVTFDATGKGTISLVDSAT